jgi:hypothetical protein
MKKLILKTAVMVMALSTTAHAACYADYKAKQDNPLKLHYGVMKLSSGDCGGVGNPKAVVSQRLSQNGWKLLNVMGTFDDSQLDRRRGNAGQFFLKY